MSIPIIPIEHSNSIISVEAVPCNFQKDKILSKSEEIETRIANISINTFEEGAANATASASSAGLGRIFVLIGTSTAGKTSIIQELCKDPEWHEMGIDLTLFSAIAKHIKDCKLGDYQLLADDYALLAEAIEDIDIANAVLVNTVKYKDNIPQAVKKKADEALVRIKERKDQIMKSFDPKDLETEMHDAVIEKFKEGKHVIFDYWSPEPFLEYIQKNNIILPVNIGLAYCSFQILLDRVKERNINALKNNDEANWRSPLNPLKHFTNLYGPADPADLEEKKVLETINRQQAENNFEEAYQLTLDYFAKSNPDERLKIESKHDKLKIKFLAKLGFSNPDVKNVHIAPRFKEYQMVFHTATTLPEESSRYIQNLKFKA